MTFCCRGFEHWFGEAGKRGFGLFASHEDPFPTVYVIQHRALDDCENTPAFTPYPVSVISDLVILFCPWCGTKLDEFYRDSVQELDRSRLKII
jgi:hypothetical protein